MSLSSYLFQQNQMQQPISALTPKKQNIFDAYSQQIAPKELAGMETRTPTQIAYDNLLNREAEINQQNKRNNFVSGLMSGIGGLGKVIANSVVSNPYQKAGAMEGISDQETRLDGLRQAYDQARQQQNKDFVNQAREQLGLAREDEDKNWNRDLTKEQIAYKKMIDDRNYENQIKQQEIENELKNKDYNLRETIAKNAKENADRNYNLQVRALKNKPAEMTPEKKIELKVKEENAVAKAKAKREAEQDLNKALAGQQAFQSNLEHIKDLSNKSGNIAKRAFGGVYSLFSGKDSKAVEANNAMDELVSQLRQAALVASGISGESDDKAQQAKLKDIYERAGVPMNAKSLTQAQVSSIINNIENIYRQRIAEKQSFLNSFNKEDKNQFSVSW